MDDGLNRTIGYASQSRGSGACENHTGVQIQPVSVEIERNEARGWHGIAVFWQTTVSRYAVRLENLQIYRAAGRVIGRSRIQLARTGADYHIIRVAGIAFERGRDNLRHCQEGQQ